VVGPSFVEKARTGQRNMRDNKIRLINAVVTTQAPVSSGLSNKFD